jgi:hypothetical protein
MYLEHNKIKDEAISDGKTIARETKTCCLQGQGP